MILLISLKPIRLELQERYNFLFLKSFYDLRDLLVNFSKFRCKNAKTRILTKIGGFCIFQWNFPKSTVKSLNSQMHSLNFSYRSHALSYFLKLFLLLLLKIAARENLRVFFLIFLYFSILKIKFNCHLIFLQSSSLYC